MTLPQTYGTFGRDSEQGAPALRDTWRQARAKNRETHYAGSPIEGEWVPAAAIDVREGILPRGVDDATVEAYAAQFDALPPMTVQRDTFVLLGGLHRLHASVAAGSALIRIREVDCPDADLWWRAWEDNERNGRQYQLAERAAFLDRALRDGRFDSWNNTKIAAKTGLNRDTVARHRDMWLDELHPVRKTRIGDNNETVTERESHSRTISRPVAPVSDFDPGRDDWPEDEPEAPTFCDECGRERGYCTCSVRATACRDCGAVGCTGECVEPLPFEPEPVAPAPTPIRTNARTAALIGNSEALERVVAAFEGLAACDGTDTELVWCAFTPAQQRRLQARPKGGSHTVTEIASGWAESMVSTAWGERHAS